MPFFLFAVLAWPVFSDSRDPIGPEWTLVWSDEFNVDGRPDPEFWQFQTGGGGWGNKELQHYTDRPQNVRIENGHLVLESHREAYQGDPFTSGRVRTRLGWQYGRVEVRAQMPGGVGTWPAIWMMPLKAKHSDVEWPDNGELDILEHVGRDPDTVMSCFYTKNFNWMINTGKIKTVSLPSATKQFHVYSLEWDENGATYAIDGTPVHEFPNPKTNYHDWPYDQAYYLILNMAIGGFGGEAAPDLEAKQFLIDSVRIYQRTGQQNVSRP